MEQTLDQKDMEQYVEHNVKLFLNNGIGLNGFVEALLPTGFYLKRGEDTQFIFYRAVSTIQRT